MSRLTLRRLSAAAAAALLPAVLLVAPDAAAINQGTTGPETLPAVDTPMWQTNNAVWATVVSNGVLYVGGGFTSIRPPNAARGTGEVPMSRVAAFNASGPNAGKPCVAATPCPGIGVWSTQAFSHKVNSLAVTPDGKTLYAGGDFTTVRGQARGRAAAFDISLLSTAAANRLINWNPNLNGPVYSLAATDSTVYIGGTFTAAAGLARQQTAAYNRTGSITAWAPSLTKLSNATVRISALLISPNTGQVVLGGRFARVNNVTRHLIAQVDGVTGKSTGPMAPDVIPVRPGGPAEVKSLATDGTQVFLGVEGTAAFDGTAAVNPFTGARTWITDCHGATQAVAVIGEALYVGSHAHDCATPPVQGGGFSQTPFSGGGASWYHLLAERTNGNTGPAGSLLNWFPRPNPGIGTVNVLGPRAMAVYVDPVDPSQHALFVGGQSTTMNGRPQEGIAMFQSGGPGAAPSAPAVSARTFNGTTTVRWSRSDDSDDSRLTYEVLKNGIVVETQTDDAPWWKQSSYVWRDTSGAPASAYTVRVTDGSGLTAQRVATTAASVGYDAAVEAQNPSIQWRLDEPAGPTAADGTGGPAGTYRGGYTFGKPSALGGTTGAVVQNNAISTGIAPNTAVAAAPSNYSLEMWFNTDSAFGGRLIGFSSSATGTTAAPTRTLYMNNGGQLMYGIRTADGSTCKDTNTKYRVQGLCYLWSKQSYNDGTWHHVVVTQSTSSGMALYVDGARVGNDIQGKAARAATGVWRVGGDGLDGMPRRPGFAAMPGYVDEVAVYPTALNATQVAAHYAAAQ